MRYTNWRPLPFFLYLYAIAQWRMWRCRGVAKRTVQIVCHFRYCKALLYGHRSEALINSFTGGVRTILAYPLTQLFSPAAGEEEISLVWADRIGLLSPALFASCLVEACYTWCWSSRILATDQSLQHASGPASSARTFHAQSVSRHLHSSSSSRWLMMLIMMMMMTMAWQSLTTATILYGFVIIVCCQPVVIGHGNAVLYVTKMAEMTAAFGEANTWSFCLAVFTQQTTECKIQNTNKQSCRSIFAAFAVEIREVDL